MQNTIHKKLYKTKTIFVKWCMRELRLYLAEVPFE